LSVTVKWYVELHGRPAGRPTTNPPDEQRQNGSDESDLPHVATITDVLGNLVVLDHDMSVDVGSSMLVVDPTDDQVVAAEGGGPIPEDSAEADELAAVMHEFGLTPPPDPRSAIRAMRRQVQTAWSR